ncbi:hypothetical protein [Mesorhizobium sp. M0047]|uniref:hypothetical protein n=1 Tax=Mesorhizobium sp. M0047 TaxID=2956859 RepID=UPI00333628B2
MDARKLGRGDDGFAVDVAQARDVFGDGSGKHFDLLRQVFCRNLSWMLALHRMEAHIFDAAHHSAPARRSGKA